MPEPMLSIRGARKSFPSPGREPLLVLDGLDLDVLPGEFLVVLGPSGCGKSTLLDIIAGQSTLDAGEVRIDGLLQPKNPSKLSVVWQGDSLMPWKTAWQNIEFALLARMIPPQERYRAIAHWLGAVNMRSFADYLPGELSQGMRQRVALAAALATGPRVLLMDEPFAALDVQTKLRIEQELVSLWEQLDLTVVMVTHDVQEAAALSDRVIVLGQRPAVVRRVYDNPLPRPRDFGALLGSRDFHDFVRAVWTTLLS